MLFFWQKSDGATRLANADLAADEKLNAEPAHTPRLTDEEAHIIHNLVELQLIDAGEEEIFLRRKENQDGMCLDERKERGPAGEGCPVSRLVVRKPAGSVWSLLLHILAVLCAVMGRRFLNQTKNLLEWNKHGKGAGDIASRDYRLFMGHGAPDVHPLVSNSQSWTIV